MSEKPTTDETASEAGPVDEFDDWDEFHASDTEPHTLGPISSNIYFEADSDKYLAEQGFRTWEQWIAERLFIEKYNPGYATSQESREQYDRIMALVAESQPAALPKPGDTSTPQRIDVNTPDLTGDNLTVRSTVALYQVSERTVMAKLRAGKVPGAAKIPGANGELWALPVASVAQLWKVRTETPGVAAPTQPAEADQSQLLRELIAEVALLRNQIADLEQIAHRALPAAPANETTSTPAPAHRAQWWKRTK